MVENIILGNSLDTLYKNGILKLNTEYKVRLKTYDKCKKILGEHLISSHSMVKGFRENIKESSKDNPLDYIIKLRKYTPSDARKGTYVEIVKHPKTTYDYKHCCFESALFEYLETTEYKTGLEL